MSEILITTDLKIDAVLSLWSEIFGKDEALLEKVQIDGSEDEYNTDIVFSALEGKNLLGTVHITVSRKFPEFGGISGVCTAPSARGKGVAKLLFEKAIEELSKMGVKLVFLGTSNSIAAKLYESFGFSFLPGSHVMVNSFYESYQDYFKKLFINQTGFCVSSGTPDLRLPIIPLVSSIENQLLLDINTGITSSALFTQKSCMGLFPRYLKLREDGGSYYCVTSKNNVTGAIASVAPTSSGMRADFFCAPCFENSLPMLIAKLESDFDALYFQISDADKRKSELIISAGFSPCEKILYTIHDTCRMQTTIYKKL